jgi:hypothetical protein
LNLRKRLEPFWLNYEPNRSNNTPKPALLSSTEWEKIEHIHTALHAFYEVTVTAEGHADTLKDYVVNLDYLHQQIDHTRSVCFNLNYDEPSEENSQLHRSASESWVTLERYINYCDDSGAYYAAHVLNPALKWSWFESTWREHPEKAAWLPQVKQLVEDLWQEEYQSTF